MSIKAEEHIIYFLGIGGIGMSALARYFIAKGYEVHGYDRTITPLTQSLEKEGMCIHYHEDSTLIPAKTGLVIYTPAIPATNTEYIYLQQSGIRMMKRAEVLGMLSSEYKSIGCAGTHGKTTTSTMVAYLLHQSHLGCQAFLGGISQNFDTNLLLSETSPFLVAEADEYDRSFLQLHPYIAIITSMDSDHLDIYLTHDAIFEAFKNYASNIVNSGFLILKKGLEKNFPVDSNYKIYTYAVEKPADFCAKNLQLINGLYQFDFHYPAGKIDNLTLGIPGLYNVENAVAAIAAALQAGVKPEEISNSLKGFKGVKRRFDLRINEPNLVYIDDYAHHPSEIDACIQSARAMFPGKKITGIFQPHLYSRTKDFAHEFAVSLMALDEVILLPIYPARELPVEGINSQLILSLINHNNKTLVRKEDLPGYFMNKKPEVLITMGAGDIDTLVTPIENYFKTIQYNHS